MSNDSSKKHLTDDATIHGALKELVEGNGWDEVILCLDDVFRRPSEVDESVNPDIEALPMPMSVDVSFPRRQALAEGGGADYSQLYPRDN
ncbi:hypothetical protein [Salinibacter altiplanensis]|uniref:hypothetical protein n=1 Tax=Salinibacter altiplanensis TaxID=1803181 RepID=UPI000C9FEA44|nr:hypothetical protein [Salinibacter altiplanensis]